MSFMLTLASNPHDPFTEYDEWKKFDTREGFDTDGFMARLVSSSSDLSDADQELAEKQACESVLQNPSFTGLYEMVESKD